jgi:hypothetical protein
MLVSVLLATAAEYRSAEDMQHRWHITLGMSNFLLDALVRLAVSFRYKEVAVVARSLCAADRQVLAQQVALYM